MKTRILARAILSLAILMLANSPVAAAGTQCNKPDKNFQIFAAHFSGDSRFRASRMAFPVIYREGGYISPGAKIELWDQSRLEAEPKIMMLAQPQLAEQGLRQDILVETSFYIEVLQSRAEADDYRLLYKFRNIGSCWFLIEIDDQSE
jgi:hypothetical protein